MKDLETLITMALDDTKDGIEEHACDIVLKEDGHSFNAYEALVGYREITFFTDKAHINYVIDTIGFKNYLSLTHIEY